MWKAFCWLVCNCENASRLYSPAHPTKSTVVSQVSPRAKLSDTFAPNEEKNPMAQVWLKVNVAQVPL